jgi:hypothetical protein
MVGVTGKVAKSGRRALTVLNDLGRGYYNRQGDTQGRCRESVSATYPVYHLDRTFNIRSSRTNYYLCKAAKRGVLVLLLACRH